MKKAFTFQSQVREEDSSFSIVFVFENGGYGASEVGKKKERVDTEVKFTGGI